MGDRSANYGNMFGLLGQAVMGDQYTHNPNGNLPTHPGLDRQKIEKIILMLQGQSPGGGGFPASPVNPQRILQPRRPMGHGPTGDWPLSPRSNLGLGQIGTPVMPNRPRPIMTNRPGNPGVVTPPGTNLPGPRPNPMTAPTSPTYDGGYRTTSRPGPGISNGIVNGLAPLMGQMNRYY